MSRNSLLETGAISDVLSDSNGIRTHNHLVKLHEPLNGHSMASLAKWLSVCADKCSQYSPITWPVWLNCCVFVYELCGCGYKSCRGFKD